MPPCKIKGCSSKTHEDAHALTVMASQIAAIVAAWPRLPAPLKAAIMGIIQIQQ
ncbi:MAG: hypothetical protein K8R87_07340 [Verrucomicrobia bacterium]|nr:hypothetical protein [Verrucomicrobiota bacterium]